MSSELSSRRVLPQSGEDPTARGEDLPAVTTNNQTNEDPHHPAVAAAALGAAPAATTTGGESNAAAAVGFVLPPPTNDGTTRGDTTPTPLGVAAATTTTTAVATTTGRNGSGSAMDDSMRGTTTTEEDAPPTPPTITMDPATVALAAATGPTVTIDGEVYTVARLAPSGAVLPYYHHDAAAALSTFHSKAVAAAAALTHNPTTNDDSNNSTNHNNNNSNNTSTTTAPSWTLTDTMATSNVTPVFCTPVPPLPSVGGRRSLPLTTTTTTTTTTTATTTTPLDEAEAAPAAPPPKKRKRGRPKKAPPSSTKDNATNDNDTTDAPPPPPLPPPLNPRQLQRRSKRRPRHRKKREDWTRHHNDPPPSHLDPNLFSQTDHAVYTQPWQVDWLGPTLRHEASQHGWPKEQRPAMAAAAAETEPAAAAPDTDEPATNQTTAPVAAAAAAETHEEEGPEPENDNDKDPDDDDDEIPDMPNGMADVDRLAAKVGAIFTMGREFCNIFQAKQMADYVLGPWGVRVRLNSGLRISCSYGNIDTPSGRTSTTAKPPDGAAAATTRAAADHQDTGDREESADAAEETMAQATTEPNDDEDVPEHGRPNGTESNETNTTDGNTMGDLATAPATGVKRRLRRAAKLSSIHCPFLICLAAKHSGGYETREGEKVPIPRSRNPVCVVAHHLLHNHECSADTYDYAGKQGGVYRQQKSCNHMAPAIRPIRLNPEEEEETNDNDNEGTDQNGRNKPKILQDPRMEQTSVPWGNYHFPPGALEYLRKYPDKKPMDLNWLCSPLLEEAEKVWPKPGDISPLLVANADRLHECMKQIFYRGREFCNIYQAHQFGEYVMGRWGAKLKQFNSTALACCYGHPANRTKRRWDEGIPFKRRKSAPAISATGCPFQVHFTFRYRAEGGDGRKRLTRSENPVRVTIFDLTHNHDCSAESLKNLKQSSGAYTQNLEPSAWKEIQEVLSDDEETDHGSALREILRPYFAPTVPITSSVLSNVRSKARAMRAKNTQEEEEEDDESFQKRSAIVFRRQSYQPLDMALTLEDHFTCVNGFVNNIHSEANPRGKLQWFRPPDCWSEEEVEEGEKGRWHIDPESGALILYPTAKKCFWRRTHFDPIVIQDEGAFLYATLDRSRSFTVESSFLLEAACQSDEAGLMIRYDEEHWIKVGIELSDGKIRLSCVVTNVYSDWSSHSSSWPFTTMDTHTSRTFHPNVLRRTARRNIFQAGCALRIHCRRNNIIVEAKQDDDDDGWELIRLAHLMEGTVDLTETEETEKDQVKGPSASSFWVGVFACAPQEQQGGHATFNTFRVMEGSSYDTR